jgi:hypothetical protein
MNIYLRVGERLSGYAASRLRRAKAKSKSIRMGHSGREWLEALEDRTLLSVTTKVSGFNAEFSSSDSWGFCIIVSSALLMKLSVVRMLGWGRARGTRYAIPPTGFSDVERPEPRKRNDGFGRVFEEQWWILDENVRRIAAQR